MNITVFGANGFLGRHLIKGLATQEGVSIRAFDRFSSYRQGLAHPFDEYDNVEIVAGDFYNHEAVADSLVDTDVVFHLISSTTPAASLNDPLIDINTNLRASVELFQQCVDKGVKKVIYFSSGGSVYGDVDANVIKEDIPLNPRSPYAICKVAIENYLRYFRSMHGLDYTVYRIANPYGPGQNIHGSQGVIPIFLRHHLENEPIDIMGDGTMVQDYIFIDDLIAMVVASYSTPGKHTVYNLGSGHGYSINDIVGSIERCVESNLEKNHIESPSAYVDHNVLSNERFVADFGVIPTTPLDDGIRRTWEYVKQLD